MIRIWLTRPNQPRHPIEERVIARWEKLAGTLDAKLEIVEPKLYEIHGELLTRIWSMIRQDPKDTHLISETDFSPSRMLLSLIKNPRAATFTEFGNRDGPTHEFLHYDPLTAPWFMILNPSRFRTEPRLDWLGAAGPFNDAANYAYLNGVLDGCFFGDEVVVLRTFDHPSIRGAHYAFGTHFMWLRHWHDPPNSRLFPDDYTVQKHLAAIEEILRYEQPIL